MKNLLKIWALSLALVAVVFMMNTNAQVDDIGALNLRITGTTWSCDYGTHLDLGDFAFQYASHSVTGAFLTTTGVIGTGWACHDSKGVATWGLTVKSSDVFNTTTTNSAHTIPATSVSIKSPSAVRDNGSCTINDWASDGTSIAINNTVLILGKTSAQGEACDVSTTNVDLSVLFTGSQAIGQYSGTLTINVPSL